MFRRSKPTPPARAPRPHPYHALTYTPPPEPEPEPEPTIEQVMAAQRKFVDAHLHFEDDEHHGTTGHYPHPTFGRTTSGA